jgi:dCMP deaminase
VTQTETTRSLDDTFLAMAVRVAERSPDPSTQNGAVLVPLAGMLVSGYNRFPDGVAYSDERWLRPAKYSYVEHAERNAVYAAARYGTLTHGATLYCPWAACADCARAIIQAGIVRLVRLGSMSNTNERWDDSVRVGDVMLAEAGVAVNDLIIKPVGVTLRRNGDEVKF